MSTVKFNNNVQSNVNTANDFATLVARLAKMQSPATKHAALIDVLRTSKKLTPDSTFEVLNDEGKTEYTGTFVQFFALVDSYPAQNTVITEIESLREKINELKTPYETLVSAILPAVDDSKEVKVTISKKVQKVYDFDL